MTILDKLFEGSIQPSGRSYNEPEINKQRKQYTSKQQEFINGLSKEQQDMYDEVCTEENLLGGLYQKEAFKDGFKLAMQFMKEVESYDSIKHLVEER